MLESAFPLRDNINPERAAIFPIAKQLLKSF